MKTKARLVLMFLFFFAFLLSIASPICCAAEKQGEASSLQPSSITDGGIFNMTFKSKLDSSFQPLLIKTPKNYNKTQKWPLLVVLHGLGDGPILVSGIDSMVQIGPFGRGDLWYRGLGEQDIFESIELAKELFNIDDNRIYLCGFSMGGAGTFELGLKHPDIWAACVPVCGKLSDTYLIKNGRNLPFWINTGSKDEVVPARLSKKVYDQAVKLGFDSWKYTEHEGMRHSFYIDWDQVEKWLLSHTRSSSPKNFTYCSDSPGKSYWAEIVKKNFHDKTAEIKVELHENHINVTLKNVAEYALYLKDAPAKTNQEITISENDKKIFQGHISSDGIFDRKLDGKKTNRVSAE